MKPLTRILLVAFVWLTMGCGAEAPGPVGQPPPSVDSPGRNGVLVGISVPESVSTTANGYLVVLRDGTGQDEDCDLFLEPNVIAQDSCIPRVNRVFFPLGTTAYNNLTVAVLALDQAEDANTRFAASTNVIAWSCTSIEVMGRARIGVLASVGSSLAEPVALPEGLRGGYGDCGE